MKTLVLKLSGPMQSWGTSSDFDIRHTDLYPSKSAIVGLLAACLGYKRNDQENLDKLRQIDFALRIDQRGQITKDFQAVKKWEALTGKKANDNKYSYITDRYYIEDGVFLVAISHQDENYMDQIHESIKRPYFQPYLGRRSYVITKDFIQKYTDKDPIQALEDHPWQASAWRQRKNKNSSVDLDLYADSKLLENERHHMRRDQVRSFSFENRSFEYRYESKTKARITIKDDADHDAFGGF